MPAVVVTSNTIKWLVVACFHIIIRLLFSMQGLFRLAVTGNLVVKYEQALAHEPFLLLHLLSTEVKLKKHDELPQILLSMTLHIFG